MCGFVRLCGCAVVRFYGYAVIAGIGDNRAKAYDIAGIE